MSVRVGSQVAGRGRLCGERFYLPAEPRGELVSRSPVDPAEVIGSFPFGAEDVTESVVAAARVARPWGQEELPTRMRALAGLRTELVRTTAELSAIVSRETGRPAWECQREVQGLVARLDQMLADAPALLVASATILAGAVMAGAVVSWTVTVNSPSVMLPLASPAST